MFSWQCQMVVGTEEQLLGGRRIKQLHINVSTTQKPVIETSKWVPSTLFIVAWPKCKVGSICTPWQTSVSKEAVKSQISLCLMVGNPPLMQEKARSMENLTPQGQWLGSQTGSQPYWRAMTTQKAVLWRANLCSYTVSAVSQLKEPLSEANFKAHFSLLSLEERLWTFSSRP